MLNFSGLGRRLIANRGLLGVFLLCAGFASADCTKSIYPNSAAAELLADADAVRALRIAAQYEADLCPMFAQDLAQLYFWGGPAATADLPRSYELALKSHVAARWPYELRLLRGAYVLAGLDASYSPEEAMRQFQREIDSGEPLRSDKALAVLNQLASLLPHLVEQPNTIFNDRALRDEAVGISAAVVLAQRTTRLRLLAINALGMPQLAWTPTSAIKSPSTYASQNGLYFQRRPPVGARGEQDSRQQVWQVPESAPRTGVLISRFRQRDGSPYESRCTATQLSGRWLISAAHCLFAPDGSQFLLSLRYVVSSVSQIKSTAVTAAWLHNKHDPADQSAGNIGRFSGSDITLLKLNQSLTLDRPPRLAALQHGRAENWLDSFAYPSDKALHSLWLSRCRAKLWQRGELNLSDLYSLDCLSHEGQSGAVLLQTIDGKPHIVGVLSARIHNEKINQPIFAVLNAGLIADIERVVAEKGEMPANFSAYNMMHTLAELPSQLLP